MRLSVEQRCSCDRCAYEGRHTAASRAECVRCRVDLIILHWLDVAPLSYGTCPDCSFHGAFALTELAPITDMTELEELVRV